MFTTSTSQRGSTAGLRRPDHSLNAAAPPLQSRHTHRIRNMKCITGSKCTCRSNSTSRTSCTNAVKRSRIKAHVRLQPCRAFQHEDPSCKLVISWQGITAPMVSIKPLDRKQLLLSVAQQACGWDLTQWDDRYSSLVVILPDLGSLLQRMNAAQLLNLMERPAACAAALVHLTDKLPAGCDATHMAASFPGLLCVSGPELVEALELARVTFSKEQRLSDEELSVLLMQHPNLLDLQALKAAAAESVRWFRRPGTKMTLHILDQGEQSVYIILSPLYDPVGCVWVVESLPPADVPELV